MPELPEVETILRSLPKSLYQQTIQNVVVRQPKLRWPIPSTLATQLIGTKIVQCGRRGKYLLMQTATGTVIVHFGMSGRIQLLSSMVPFDRHDHLDIVFDGGLCLRFRDPRRFGCVLWTKDDPLQHPLLKNLGPEPMSEDFTSGYLYHQAKKRKQAVKLFIMNSHIVVGVGNIYANEALFKAGIQPNQKTNQLTHADCLRLVQAIQSVLEGAISQGGSSLRDFKDSTGALGHFTQSMKVYGRGSLPCLQCEQPLLEIRLGQRTTVYCSRCQQ
jgi:formamidopyrimidine-DNA glycosylase